MSQTNIRSLHEIATENSEYSYRSIYEYLLKQYWTKARRRKIGIGIACNVSCEFKLFRKWV